jgi:predicted kinase
MKSFLEFITEGKVINFEDANEGNFVILMGAPGSGKSKIVENLINIKNARIFNVDFEREATAKRLNLNLNKPEDNDEILKFTHPSTSPSNRTIKLLRTTITNANPDRYLPNIVFDTVGTHVDLIKELISLAKSKGYITTMVLSECDLETALERNRRRERQLADDVVIDYNNRVKRTFDILFPLYDNAWIVDNSRPFDHKIRRNIATKIK